VIILNKIT